MGTKLQRTLSPVRMPNSLTSSLKSIDECDTDGILFIMFVFALQIGDEFDQSRMILLYEVLGLAGNIGQLPAKFKVCQTDC